MGLLRFLFALSVLIHHSGTLFGYDLLGREGAVRGFYIISGFYMGLILNTKYTQKRGYLLFLTNRALRIFPLYWVILFLTLIFIKVFSVFGGNVNGYGGVFEQSSIFLYKSIFDFLRDFTLILRTDYITPTTQQPLLVSQAVTLVIELIFYFLAPFIVRRKLKYLFLLLLISIGLRIGTVALFRLVHAQYNGRVFPAELLYFVIGAIAYKFYEKIKSWPPSRKLVNRIMFGIIAITLIYPFTLGHWYIKIRWMEVNLWVYLVLLAVSLPFIFYATKSNKIDRAIGELSYPIYLSHVLVYALLSFTILKALPQGWFTLAVIAVTVPFSMLLHYSIEKPINYLRQMRFKKAEKLKNAAKVVTPQPAVASVRSK